VFHENDISLHLYSKERWMLRIIAGTGKVWVNERGHECNTEFHILTQERVGEIDFFFFIYKSSQSA